MRKILGATRNDAVAIKVKKPAAEEIPPVSLSTSASFADGRLIIAIRVPVDDVALCRIRGKICHRRIARTIGGRASIVGRLNCQPVPDKITEHVR